MPRRITCTLLALALACTLVPAGALCGVVTDADAATVTATVTYKSSVTLPDGAHRQTKGVASGSPDCWVGSSGTVAYSGSASGARFVSSATSVLTVDASSGAYTIVGEGVAKVSVRGVASGASAESEVASYTLLAGKNLKRAGTTLRSTKGTVHLAGVLDTQSEVTVRFKKMPALAYSSFAATTPSEKLTITSASFDASAKTVTLVVSGVGVGVMKITVNNKTFTYRLTCRTVTLAGGTALVAKGTTLSLRARGYAGKLTAWTSTREKIATVSAKGTVRARRIGTTIVRATMANGKRVGCAVSVVGARRLKVIRTARHIAQGTYSQTRRMQKGYYDCSSLVWRAYRVGGITFGVTSGWAPVAATIGKWCMRQGRKIKGGCRVKNVQNYVLRAGDLLFRTGSDNGRFRGIYHVEMLRGYAWLTDSDGKPVVTLAWVNRENGYAVGEANTLMARM